MEESIRDQNDSLQGVLKTIADSLCGIEKRCSELVSILDKDGDIAILRNPDDFWEYNQGDYEGEENGQR